MLRTDMSKFFKAWVSEEFSMSSEACFCLRPLAFLAWALTLQEDLYLPTLVDGFLMVFDQTLLTGGDLLMGFINWKSLNTNSCSPQREKRNQEA